MTVFKTPGRRPGVFVSDGLLFGRYARCNLELDHDRVSRVRLLLVRDGDQVLAIDTASSNGTAAQGEPFKVRRVDAATVFSLAGEIALVWSEAGSNGPERSGQRAQ